MSLVLLSLRFLLLRLRDIKCVTLNFEIFRIGSVQIRVLDAQLRKHKEKLKEVAVVNKKHEKSVLNLQDQNRALEGMVRTKGLKSRAALTKQVLCRPLVSHLVQAACLLQRDWCWRAAMGS